MGNCTDGKVFCVQELASAELRFETSSDGVPLAVLTKGEVPMMRVVAELMIAANAAVATRVFAHTPASAFVRRHGEFLFVSVWAISMMTSCFVVYSAAAAGRFRRVEKALGFVRCRAGRVERSCAGEVAG